MSDETLVVIKSLEAALVSAVSQLNQRSIAETKAMTDGMSKITQALLDIRSELHALNDHLKHPPAR